MVRLCGLALVLLVCLATPAVQAGGFSNPDMGGRRMGMFAVVAQPDDVSAIFHNPAGLVLLDGTQFYHAQSWFFVDFAMKLYDSQGVLRPDHELKPDWSVGFLPFLGISSDFGTERFRGGVAIFAPNAYGAAMPDDEPTRYHVTKALFLAGRAAFAAAYRITKHLSIGATADLMYIHLMANRIFNTKVMANPDLRFADPAELADSDWDMRINGNDFSYAWNVGLLLEPTDDLAFGFKFASGTNVELQGDVSVEQAQTGEKYSATQTTQMTIPLTLRAGVNWEFVENFQVGADIFYWHYQVLQEQWSKLDEKLLGIGEFRDPKNYGNSWAWNVGLLYRVLPNLELMVGYQQDFTPIPTTTYTLENPSRDQFGVSAGARWRINEDFRVSLGMVRNWFDLADVQDSMATPPSNAKGHASNFEVAFDLQWRL